MSLIRFHVVMLLCLAGGALQVYGQALPTPLQAKQDFGLPREPALVSRWVEDLMVETPFPEFPERAHVPSITQSVTSKFLHGWHSKEATVHEGWGGRERDL